MRLNWRIAAAAAVTAACLLSGSTYAAEPAKTKDLISFGTLRQPTAEVAKADAAAWLKAAGKTDADSQKAFEAVWSSEKPLLDKVADTFALGNADAKALLAEARNQEAAAPTELPALLKDTKQPAYFRANLTLAYAKALSNRRVYEESGAALKLIKADQTVDPGTYYFHKAVAEHALMMKPQADESIGRLLDDVGDAPERYRMVGALMHFDMMTWNEKDLGWVARKMDNIQRRLDLVRGGKETQRQQKEVIVRLDEMIKELENQQGGGGGGGGGNGGNCPPGGGAGGGGPPQGIRPSNPATESGLPSADGKGEIDPKKVKELAEVWGKLPEKERAKAMLELTRDLPPKYKEAIETYIRESSSRAQPK